MAKKATAKKNTKTVKKMSGTDEVGKITAAAAILFAGAVISLIAIVQKREDMKLLIIGFGAALLLFGVILLSTATKTVKKK